MKFRILSSFNIIFYSELLAEFAYGVPPDYCLEALNTSDCGRSPTPVFSYYKPGSRCEIEFWRGCPTVNKFTDEVECSHNCIARLSFGVEDVLINSDEAVVASKLQKSTSASVVVTSPAPVNIDPCKTNLNPPNCAKTENFTVYTYDSTLKTCVEGIWFGCETSNKFSDEKSCWNFCVKDKKWKEKITTLKDDEVDDINDVLNDLIQDSDEEEITKATTEEITKPPLQETTVAPRKETTEVPHEETTEVPREETTEVPRVVTTERPPEETTEPPHEETTEDLHKETTEPPHEETTEDLHKETTEAPHEETTHEETTTTTEQVTTEHLIETTVASASDEHGSAEEVITT